MHEERTDRHGPQKPLSRLESTEFLSSLGDIVHRRTGSAWAGADAIINRQVDCDVEAPPLDALMLELCVSGYASGEHHFDGRATPARSNCRPGALFFFPDHRPRSSVGWHGVTANLQILIDPRVINEVKAELLQGDADRADLLGFTGLHDLPMRRYAESIQHELLNPSPGGALIGDAMAQSLCVEICRRFTTGTLSTRRRTPLRLSPAQLDRAFDALEASIDNKPGLQAIAEAVGVSTFHFARAFKAATGQTPHQHLIERRIARACEALEYSDDTIATIAYTCGFCSQAHLTSTFARHLGISPGRYREVRRR